MSYTCPVCNNCLGAFFDSRDMTNVRCRHTLNKYVVCVLIGGYVNVYRANKAGDTNGFLLTLKSPKRLSEEYIDMVLLLK